MQHPTHLGRQSLRSEPQQIPSSTLMEQAPEEQQVSNGLAVVAVYGAHRFQHTASLANYYIIASGSMNGYLDTELWFNLNCRLGPWNYIFKPRDVHVIGFDPKMLAIDVESCKFVAKFISEHLPGADRFEEVHVLLVLLVRLCTCSIQLTLMMGANSKLNIDSYSAFGQLPT